MSDNTTNTCSSADTTQRRTPSGTQNRKNKWVHKKLARLENRCADGKHKYSDRPGQFRPYQAPRQNGASTKHPSRPSFTHNKSLPPSSSTASASSLSSKPRTSIHSQPSSTLAVNNRGCHDKTKEPVSTNSRPSLSSSHKPTATQTSARIPTKYLAIDCEMVGTGPKGSISQLARCSIVSYDGDVVYDKFINPSVPVTDYRTRWSGIQRRDLVNATPYCEARNEILRLLMGKVVIGHAVHNDFKVLGYTHPAAFTRDTSQIPLLNLKAGFAVNECASLKRLTKAILNKDIQTGKKGHSSVEDARATMELYKLVEEEWERKLASS
ncbi:interferon-stimulated 20 kDa exonuclease-like 2 [Pempheris klunzingeri]|uniref:interferon-stimulated 20 kDa exonuclease-like 2 n=1 Tax=Pempheris klunzingeri TaxID=3127111 RepID=UPI003980FCA0